MYRDKSFRPLFGNLSAEVLFSPGKAIVKFGTACGIRLSTEFERFDRLFYTDRERLSPNGRLFRVDLCHVHLPTCALCAVKAEFDRLKKTGKAFLVWNIEFEVSRVESDKVDNSSELRICISNQVLAVNDQNVIFSKDVQKRLKIIWKRGIARFSTFAPMLRHRWRETRNSL